MTAGGPTSGRGDVERALRLIIEEREALLEAERARVRELEQRLLEQYQLVARYRAALRPVLVLRDLLRRDRVRRLYGHARAWAWRHPVLARPGVWAKRFVRWVLPAGWGVSRVSSDPASDPARDRFDASWYLAQNPELAIRGEDPWAHYCREGWRQGRDPHPLFDVDHYLAENPDVAQAGTEPWRHYIQGGWRDGRNPNPLFDVGWYLTRNPEVATAGTEPLEHYSSEGWQQGRDPGPLFSVSWYLSRLAERTEPLRHYLEIGIAEGRTTCRSHEMALIARLGDLGTSWNVVADGGSVDIRAIGHPGAHDVVIFDAESLWECVHGEQAPDRAVLRSVCVELDRSSEDLASEDLGSALAAHRGAQLDVAEGLVRSRLDVFRARWMRPRPVVTRALDQLREFGGQQLQVRADEDDLLLLRQLGIDLDGIEIVDDVRLPDGTDAVHVTCDPEGSCAPQVIAVSKSGLESGRDGLDVCDATLGATAQLLMRVQRELGTRRVVKAAFDASLLPASLVIAAMDHAVRHGLDRVHYLSREGEFLARLHVAVAERLYPGGAPSAVHLQVSRRSTFGPSLHAFDREALMDLWRMYSRQSVRALLASLGVEADELGAVIARHGIEVDKTIENIHEDEATLRFLADAQVTERLAARNATRREALLTYLRQRTDLSLDRWLVVDVGWRGTIQDNLARLLPHVHIDGIYLANFPFLNPQPTNTTKSAIAIDGNAGDDFAFMEPPAAVERPWTADVASVVDYTVDDEGRARAVHEKENLARVQSGLIDLFQASTIRAAEVIADHVSAYGLSAEDLAATARDLLPRYYRDPFAGVADLWFGSEHDDTFGVLNVTPFAKDRPSSSWFGAGLRGVETYVERAATASQWAAGYRRWLPVEALDELARALRSGGFSTLDARRPGDAPTQGAARHDDGA